MNDILSHPFDYFLCSICLCLPSSLFTCGRLLLTDLSIGREEVVDFKFVAVARRIYELSTNAADMKLFHKLLPLRLN